MHTTALRSDADLDRAAATLAARDEVMAGLVAAHGPIRLGRRVGSHFEALARSIVFQQLSGRAAGTIWRRFRALVDGRLDPGAVLALDADRLRGAGLSSAKAASVRDLAQHLVDGRLDLARIARRSDDQVVAAVTEVRGIGPWTAQMFLLFQLRRPDVWPTTDLGVRNGYAAAYGMADAPEPRHLEDLGDRFRPLRSVAALYCWRAVDAATP